MTCWRMAFRVGTNGPSMLPKCQRWGVAAIMYDPLVDTGLSKYGREEPQELWAKLASPQKASLRRVAYEMKAGDFIYVKEGPEIVDRGTVLGAYEFNAHTEIYDQNKVPWRHQVPVEWSRNFSPVKLLLGKNQRYTVEELSATEIESAFAAIDGSEEQQDAIDNMNAHRMGLLEERYYRECPARLKVITPLHKMLSNKFCRWLSQHSAYFDQEKANINVTFKIKNITAIAELKICCGVGTRKSIREALG
jgi:hypothetical protein